MKISNLIGFRARVEAKNLVSFDCDIFTDVCSTWDLINTFVLHVQFYLSAFRCFTFGQYTPITPLMCRRFRKFSKLRSCKLLQSNPKVLDDYSAKYFTSLNQWKSVTFLNRRGVGSLGNILYIKQCICNHWMLFKVRGTGSIKKQ